MKKKILFVVTSHNIKGHTGKPTGYYLSEVTHPWKVLRNAGYEIDFVSPKGGKSPVEGLDLKDPVNKKFWENKIYKFKIDNTKKPSEINPDDYQAVYYAGGHGTMWDFPDNEALAEITRRIYERGGIVGAVCHGPSGFVNLKLSDGNYLVSGKKLNSYTNEEEIAGGMERVVPFLLESKLIHRGAKFEKSGPKQPHVARDERLITGQNPASAKGVADAMLEEIRKLEQSNKEQAQQQVQWH
ncbi:MAG TPA: type 1 glutamine amidotransferase domain-containing protein [Bacteroidales bacterium]|jgi:putative intracellular protease/amidase|nr:type 1 glutamine amidotransferase domain-containing protein [Bacteroidales bacterium]